MRSKYLGNAKKFPAEGVSGVRGFPRTGIPEALLFILLKRAFVNVANGS